MAVPSPQTFVLPPIDRGVATQIQLPDYEADLVAAMGLATGRLVADFKNSPALTAPAVLTVSTDDDTIIRSISSTGAMTLFVSISATASALMTGASVFLDFLHYPSGGGGPLPVPVLWEWPVGARVTVRP